VIHFVLHDIPEKERNDIAGCLSEKLVTGGLIFVREPFGKQESMSPDEVRELFERHGIKTISCITEKSMVAGNMSFYKDVCQYSHLRQIR
jgi:hypothetical protein